ncbi:hypothetical protein [Streptomyces sp. MBT62]|uniref:hypothetical protein n=1 Tax=Streptomyces sp. MBT62 TaxID=2800410 RepID=UPI00190B2AEF|nr:hypothetical protein [Streptomyces sp. MBT62]MBK3569169.1 hypothetical protein [Streptomyces sp. MBT62]
MVRKSSKAAAKPRPKRPPIRLGEIKTGRIVNRLRELYELGGDPEYERFPASEELFLVLDHAQKWAGKLKQPKGCLINVVGEAAVLRAKLWQYLREQADAGQLKAIEDGRAAGVPWNHFTEALCVTSKQGAYQKARRLKAEQVREPGEHRTPEIAREHEDCAAAEERAERALMLVQERRFPVARQVGRLLLEDRDGIVLDTWATYWLGEIAETIDDRDDPAKRARFTGWVESFVRAVHGHARQRNQPSTTTEEARRALALATEFTFQEQPKIPRQVSRSQTGNPARRERRRTRGDRADR